MRTPSDIRDDLNAAHALDRTFRLNTPEFKANRQRIGSLMRELSELEQLTATPISELDYEAWPDSFEQMGANRQRAAAVQLWLPFGRSGDGVSGMPLSLRRVA